MNDYILEQVARLLYKFGVQPNGASLGIAAAPLGGHPLQEIAANLNADAAFPFLDVARHCAMK
ncbi:MAG: hypothetical protein OIF48_20970 [Silicimonas sp.]|nr:hypothetical protein [Silicimonas sp.]